MSGENCSGCPGNFVNYPACDKCAAGYAGERCDIACPGLGTSAGVCSGKHGTCNDQGRCDCEDGFAGTNCEECRSGYFDIDCKPCSVCQHGAACVSGIDGHCECRGNWMGSYCDVCKTNFTGDNCENCVSGRYGENCLNQCPANGGQVCSGHGTCAASPDNTTGCKCAAGWGGSDCSVCDSTHYGANCQYECPTVNGKVCGGNSCSHGFDGTGCECVSPWDGDDCSQCDSTHYGANCAKTCPTSNGGLICGGRGECRNTTSSSGCVCDAPWAGASTGCTSCDSSHYGENCAKTCPSCAHGSSCEHSTSNTVGCACKNNWSGATCSSCVSPAYGDDCQYTCMANNGSLCGGHGSCTSSGCSCEGNWGGSKCTSCKAGYTGNNCTECAAGAFKVGSECIVCDMRKTSYVEGVPTAGRYTTAANETKCRFKDTVNNVTYQLVTINGVLWMRENLRSAKDKTGAALQYDTIGSSKKAIYGYRYNYANARKACPAGWRLPTYQEFYDLFVYATNNAVPPKPFSVFKKLIAYSSNWGSPYTNKGYDSLGFSAEPGGFSSCTSDTSNACSNVDKSQYGGAAAWWNASAGSFYMYNDKIDYDWTPTVSYPQLTVRCVKE